MANNKKSKIHHNKVAARNQKLSNINRTSMATLRQDIGNGYATTAQSLIFLDKMAERYKSQSSFTKNIERSIRRNNGG